MYVVCGCHAASMLTGQFALDLLRPSGSTCALVYFMHHVCLFIETNSYIRILCIDFSKAFYIVGRRILLTRFVTLEMQPVL